MKRKTHKCTTLSTLALTLQSHPIALDGGDGVVDIFLRGRCGVHFNNLKIHGDTAKPMRIDSRRDNHYIILIIIL